MARYSKIILGPARKNDPQLYEAEAAAAVLPGTYVAMDSNGRFAAATAATEGKVWLAHENYLMLKGVDEPYVAYSAGPPVVQGDRVLALEMQDDVMYAARIATGQNVTAVGTPLEIGANGHLVIATTGRVVAYADEVFNNNTGAAALIRIRPSMNA